jgi:hypothetical protein
MGVHFTASKFNFYDLIKLWDVLFEEYFGSTLALLKSFFTSSVMKPFNYNLGETLQPSDLEPNPNFSVSLLVTLNSVMKL